MRPRRFKTILVFVLGMLTFAVGWFIVSTFIIVERPTRPGIIEDWERICFWPDVDGMTAAVSPKGCYSTTCTRPTLQAGTAIVDRRENIIQLETRFVLVEASRFPLPCIENCAGGGTVQFKLGKLMPNDYEVWFREEKVGELMIFSGRTTPRQCFESIPGLGGSSESSATGIKFDPVGPHLPEGAEVSEHLIATLELDENIDASDEPIPTTVAEPRRKASSYWNEMEDPHYGVRFAVPCFWSVDFPEIYRPGGIGYSIRNYTDEYARSFGKMESGVWESGGIKIDMNFISGDGIGVSGTQPGASLLDFAVGLFDSNPEVALISTEPRTINGQKSLLVTTESIFGIGQFYLFQVSADTYLIFTAAQEAFNNPDVRAILHSITLTPGLEVALPEIYPWNPPVGIAAPCLDPFYDHCCSVEMPIIMEKEVAGRTLLEIAGILFGRYLEAYQISVVPASCKLIAFNVEEVSEDAALVDFAREQGVDAAFRVTYSVQAAKEAYWVAGNGMIGDDGWVNQKMMLVGVTNIGNVYRLSVHGTSP